MINTNFVFAKFYEKYLRNYKAKIAIPVISVISDEKKVITPLEKNDIEEFCFCIRNYDETNISSMCYYYELRLEFGNSDIKYEVWDEAEDKKINFKDGKSELQYMDLEKREIEYKLIIDLVNSNINENTNVNLYVDMVYDEGI